MKFGFRFITTVALSALMAGSALAENTIKIGNIVQHRQSEGVAEPAVVSADIAVGKSMPAVASTQKMVEWPVSILASDPKQASVGARKLIQDDGVLAILGPFSSASRRLPSTMQNASRF